MIEEGGTGAHYLTCILFKRVALISMEGAIDLTPER